MKEYVRVKMWKCMVFLFFFFLFPSPGLQLSMQEHALGVEAEGGTLTVLVAAVPVVTGGMYTFELVQSAKRMLWAHLI